MLLPCPFCNSDKLEFSTKVAKSIYTGTYVRACIYCKNCNTYGPRVNSERTDRHYRSNIDYKALRQKAENIWNQRSTT